MLLKKLKKCKSHYEFYYKTVEFPMTKSKTLMQLNQREKNMVLKTGLDQLV